MIITIDIGKDRWVSLEHIGAKRWRVRDSKRDSYRWLRYTQDGCFWEWSPWNGGSVFATAEFKTHKEARAAAFAALLSD